MKRTGLAILSLSVSVVLNGCGVQDPDQPAVGSISINAKSDDDKPLVDKKAVKSARKPR